MNAIAIAALGLALIGATTAESQPTASLVGTWALHSEANTKGANLELAYQHTTASGYDAMSNSHHLDTTDAIEGLPLARLREPLGPVSFTLRKDAGSFDCVGSAGGGSGRGRFTFTPSQTFDDALATRGFAVPSPSQSLEFAMGDITLAFIDAYVRPGTPHATTNDVLTLVRHGVGPVYVGELADLGYRNLSIESLVRLRDHGVSTHFIRTLAESGYAHISPAELVRLADHGVSAAFISEMRKLGYTNLTPDDFVRLADHGVSAQFISKLQAHGYKNVSVDDLIRLRDSGL